MKRKENKSVFTHKFLEIVWNSYNFYILAPVEVSVCTDGGNECAGNTNGLTACLSDACVGKKFLSY